MATILDELADYARIRVEKARAVKSAEEVKCQVTLLAIVIEKQTGLGTSIFNRQQ